MKILAIDPGNKLSAYAVVDADTRRPIAFGKIENESLRDMILDGDFHDCERVYIEMIASYGMAVGAEVFQTCVWIGRYIELLPSNRVTLIGRQPVKLHHCHSTRAKDSNVIAALVERFAPGVRNRGKGTKGEPGWFYGFKADVWQAYAIGVFAADMTSPVAPDFSLSIPKVS